MQTFRGRGFLPTSLHADVADVRARCVASLDASFIRLRTIVVPVSDRSQAPALHCVPTALA